MSEQTPAPQKGSSCSRIFSWTLKMLVTIVLGVVLGVLIYYGATILYQNYVASVQTNTRQIGALDQRLGQLEELIKGKLTDVEVRLKAIEQEREGWGRELQTLGTQAAGLETAQQAHATVLAALGDPGAQATALASRAAENANRLQALETALSASEDENRRLELELQTLQAAQMLLRARSNLAAGNLGLAQQDLHSAQEFLNAIQSEQDDPGVRAALTYLASALENLPLRPVAAANAVDSAWSLLVTGAEPGPTATPTPTGTTSASSSQGSAQGNLNPGSTPTTVLIKTVVVLPTRPPVTMPPAPTEPPYPPPPPPPYPLP